MNQFRHRSLRQLSRNISFRFASKSIIFFRFPSRQVLVQRCEQWKKTFFSVTRFPRKCTMFAFILLTRRFYKQTVDLRYIIFWPLPVAGTKHPKRTPGEAWPETSRLGRNVSFPLTTGRRVEVWPESSRLAWSAHVEVDGWRCNLRGCADIRVTCGPDQIIYYVYGGHGSPDSRYNSTCGCHTNPHFPMYASYTNRNAMVEFQNMGRKSIYFVFPEAPVVKDLKSSSRFLGRIFNRATTK